MGIGIEKVIGDLDKDLFRWSSGIRMKNMGREDEKVPKKNISFKEPV